MANEPARTDRRPGGHVRLPREAPRQDWSPPPRAAEPEAALPGQSTLSSRTCCLPHQAAALSGGHVRARHVEDAVLREEGHDRVGIVWGVEGIEEGLEDRGVDPACWPWLASPLVGGASLADGPRRTATRCPDPALPQGRLERRDGVLGPRSPDAEKPPDRSRLLRHRARVATALDPQLTIRSGWIRSAASAARSLRRARGSRSRVAATGPCLPDRRSRSRPAPSGPRLGTFLSLELLTPDVDRVPRRVVDPSDRHHVRRAVRPDGRDPSQLPPAGQVAKSASLNTLITRDDAPLRAAPA